MAGVWLERLEEIPLGALKPRTEGWNGSGLEWTGLVGCGVAEVSGEGAGGAPE